MLSAITVMPAPPIPPMMRGSAASARPAPVESPLASGTMSVTVTLTVGMVKSSPVADIWAPASPWSTATGTTPRPSVSFWSNLGATR